MKAKMVWEDDGMIYIYPDSEMAVRTTKGIAASNDSAAHFWVFATELAARRFAKRKGIQLEES